MYKRGGSRDPGVRELVEILDEMKANGGDEAVMKKLQGAIDVLEERDKYSERMSTAPSQPLNEIVDETLSYPFDKAYEEKKTLNMMNPKMMSGHLEGKFLQALISMSNAKHILEIGMFTGYAALACAEVLPDDGTVTTCELDPFCKEIASGFFSKSPHGKKITVKIGPALDSLKQLLEEKAKFDLVFIDADKGNYINYFKMVMDEGLLAPRGTIILDNAFMGGHAYMPESPVTHGAAIRKCNEYLKTRDDIFQVLVPIRDGAMIVRRKTDMVS